MGWNEKAANIQGAAVRTFSPNATCLYEPTGRTAVTLRGIFRRDHQLIDPATGATVNSEAPVLEIRLADLGADVWVRPGRDFVTVPAIPGNVHPCETQYLVHAIERDGEGMGALMLHERPRQ